MLERGSGDTGACMIYCNALIVNPDVVVREELSSHFKNSGFGVRTSASGSEAELLLKEFMPEVMVINWHCEDISGIEACRRIRHNDTYKEMIIVMTGANDEDDLIHGLNVGADEITGVVIRPRELVARSNALIRRTKSLSSGTTLKFGNIELDPIEYRVRRNGRIINIGPKEFKLLYCLIQRPRKIHTRDHLLNVVWGLDSEVGQRVVDVYIMRLRRAINRPGEIDPIRTVQTVGYSMDVD